eukprot:TRINITY_DN3978_c0_g1_i1.p1 TRINITY_DN3978_c0_g1~~TRINITY_DN3978_c0_g1_i1.p1  ORF type:complete len:348 (-),score=69.64 TRINITY_DN3978_c0_g1_i1:334-1377(-)
MSFPAEEKTLTFHNKFVKGDNGEVVAFSVSERKLRYQQSKGLAWSNEEHQKFLEGLERFGKGDWRSISRMYVPHRSPSQVASHAQKYFKRLQTEAKNAAKRAVLEAGFSDKAPTHKMARMSYEHNSSTILSQDNDKALAPTHSTRSTHSEDADCHSWNDSSSGSDISNLVLPSQQSLELMTSASQPTSTLVSHTPLHTKSAKTTEQTGDSKTHLPAIPSLMELMSRPPAYVRNPTGISLFSPVLVNATMTGTQPSYMNATPLFPQDGVHVPANQHMEGSLSKDVQQPGVNKMQEGITTCNANHSQAQDGHGCSRCIHAEKRMQEMEKTILELQQEIWNLRRKSFLHS